MFFVINKEKIYAYFISIMTVVLLFYVASVSISSSGKVVETAASVDRLLPIYRVDTQEKKVALTLNCAWNADDIDSILATLQKEKVKVTFFMVGDWMTKFPEAVKKIHEAGHEIGSHSDTHPHVNQLSYEKNSEEIEKSNDKIENLIGTRTKLYRPPYGEYNNTVIQVARDKGYYPIQWSLDTITIAYKPNNQLKKFL